MKLSAIGKVKKLSKSGLVLVSLNASKLPKIGDKVVNRKMEKVGVIVDIIGPVSSPFALVKPDGRVDLDQDIFVVVKDGGSREGKRKGSREGSRKKRD